MAERNVAAVAARIPFGTALAGIRWRHFGHCLWPGLTAGLLSAFFFCPRFSIWRGLYVPQAWHNPEVCRATAELAQIDHPFAPVANPLHQVIAWRLLFPLIWCGLHLPKVLYLAMPFVGCALALALVTHLIHRESGSWWLAWLAAVLSATASWHIVSTSWLAYFDSWLVLASLAVALVGDRRWVVLACLLAPWIDERFIIGLPVALTVRTIASGWIERRAYRTILGDWAWIAAATLPYLAIRAVFWLAGLDNEPAKYHEMIRWNIVSSVPFDQFMLGAWSGMRAGWGFVLLALWLCRSRLPRPWLAAAAAVLAFAFLTALVIAADLSRSMTMLFPAMILGMIMLIRHQSALARPVFIGLAALNLLLPEQIVVWTFREPYFYFYTEYYDYLTPSDEVNPNYYAGVAETLIAQNKLPEAEDQLRNAFLIDSKCPYALGVRGLLLLRQGNLAAARPDAQSAIARAPEQSEGYWVRGQLRAAEQDNAGACQDFETALRLAPENWVMSQSCSQALAQARLRLR